MGKALHEAEDGESLSWLMKGKATRRNGEKIESNIKTYEEQELLDW